MPLISIAQEPTVEGEVSTKTAKDFYKMGDYRIAFQEYEKLALSEPGNVEYHYKAGECILKGTFAIKSNAIPFLDQASILEGAPDDVLLLLAEAYHMDYQFDKAIETATKLIENTQIEVLKLLAARRIEMVNNARVLIKNPMSVKIENLGPNVNSEYPDYYAFVQEDEEYLLYSTRRIKGNGGYIMEDGYKSADIFMVKEKHGKWHKTKTIGGILTSIYDEEIIGMSADGSTVFVNLDTYEISGEIKMATKKGRSFKPAVLLGGDISLPESVEVTACISKDKETIYFCSNRPGGEGGFDIYRSKLLPDGTWGIAVNLGPEVNTKYDEYFPTLQDNEKTLYFASKGHNSMGGFDIFKSELDAETNSWTKPINFGSPVNTVDDDFQISFTKDKRTGYITSLRPEGIGNLDIYSVTFNEVEEKQTVFTGNLFVKVPIDYNNYQVFDWYEVNGVLKRVMTEVKPRPSDGWIFVRSEKKIVKQGMKYKASVVMDIDGVEKRLSFSKAPMDNETYKLVDAKTNLVPIEKYKPPSKSRAKTTKVIIKEAKMDIADPRENGLVGSYIPSIKSGKYVMIIPEGKYKLMIYAPGYKVVTTPLHVLGKGSFKSQIAKDFELESTIELVPIHYKDLKGK